MKKDIEKLIEQIEQMEIVLYRDAPRKIGKNLSKYVKLKEKYNKMR